MKLRIILILIFVNLIQVIFADSQTTSLSSPTLKTLLTQYGYTEIPIIKKAGLLYAEGKINNHPAYFLLDTGSTNMSILSDSVEQLKLKPAQSTQKVANMSGDLSFAKNVLLAKITIGKIQLKKIAAEIMLQPFKNNLPTLVVGNNFFNKYNAIFDLQNNLLYLNQNKVSNAEHRAIAKLLENNHYQSVPLTVLSDNHFILPIQINEVLPIYFLFDTGTSDTTVSSSYVDYLKIPVTSHYKSQAATNGSINFANLTVNTITFNPLQTFFEPPIKLANRTIASADIAIMAKILGVVGILGLSEMEKLNTIIDVSSRIVFFKA